MAVDSVTIGNFKGIGKTKTIKIKPITVFVGANSSGKSSCIHALACLSQTVKLPNNTRALILDDEFAYVHLGRFIEIIHSKSYQDFLTLGISVDDVSYTKFVTDGKNRKLHKLKGTVSADFQFKCAKRTQDLFVDSSLQTLGDDQFSIKRQKDGYSIQNKDGSKKVKAKLSSKLFTEPSQILLALSDENNREFFQLFDVDSLISTELRNTFYLGPFRQPPQRRYPTRGSNPVEVGSLGESTITLLANEAIQSRTRTHIKQIAEWLTVLGVAKSLDIGRIATSDLFDVSMTLADGKTFPIADLGYGISQVLPVLAQCSFAPKGSTLLFEQPEIHLHSLAARQLASVFIKTMKEKEAHILLETHSPELVRQFFVELKSGTLDPKDFVLYRVTREGGESSINEVKIEHGDDYIDVYDNWEKGISLP